MVAKAALKSGATFVSIEADKNRKIPIEKELEEVINYKYGWSVTYDDIVKIGDSRFVESRYKTIDAEIAFGRKDLMIGEVDLIRKTIEELKLHLDFFFCDTGEYCGIAEWNIVKNKIKQGGYFVAHDIYFPKSIKCFQVIEEIENSKDWEMIIKTNSRQELAVACKLR